jgi:hypothetical protein
MATLLNRGLLLFVAFVYLAAAYHYGTPLDIAKVAVALLLPLACIWFAAALGGYPGLIHLQVMTAPTPAFLVCVGGWLLLVGVPLAAYFIMRGSEQT